MVVPTHKQFDAAIEKYIAHHLALLENEQCASCRLMLAEFAKSIQIREYVESRRDDLIVLLLKIIEEQQTPLEVSNACTKFVLNTLKEAAQFGANAAIDK